MQKNTIKGFFRIYNSNGIRAATLTVGAASGTFKDVKAGAWYEDAVLWAQERELLVVIQMGRLNQIAMSHALN